MGPLQVSLVVSAALVVLAPPPVSGCGRGAMVIENNGYRQVLIAIGEEVPENPKLIDRIKEAFTALSQRLYQATRKCAYLAQINILVPKSWNAEYEAPGYETMRSSDIVVDIPGPNQGDKPITIGGTECGRPALFMHITPNYLLNTSVSNTYGPIDKLLVHEWAHLRYGVFDEYATKSHFYSGENGTVEAIRCSSALSGYQEDKTTGHGCKSNGTLPDDNCLFIDDYGEDFNQDYGSLMYKQNLHHIVEFCDNDTNNPNVLHNRAAPTQQNKKCKKQSVWEVLRSHVDFKKSDHCGQINDTTPTFTLLKAQDKRYVLVLDISGSMRSPKKESLQRGCSNFIRDIVRDGEIVGVVHFNEKSKTAANLTKINKNTRIQLRESILVNPNGNTSIGSGLLKGIEVLKSNGRKAKGGNLIVVSDGNETADPRIKDVRDRVIHEQVIVHTIAFTNVADSHMDEVATTTGGLSFLYSDDASSNALNEGFRHIVEQNHNARDQRIPISSTAEMVSSGDQISSEVSIDSTLCKDTEFHFDYSGSDIDIVLTSPSGTAYQEPSDVVEHDTKFGLYSFKFTGKVKPGKWTYKISNTDSKEQKVAVTVLSQTSEPGTYPIMAHAFWAHREMDMADQVSTLVKQAVYASVSQGYKAVLNADVKACIEPPKEIPRDLPLKDNGVGADRTKDDGIYSEYFNFKRGDGRYNIKVLVSDTTATTISSVHLVGQGAASPQPDNNINPNVKVTHLQRVAIGGSFQVNNSAKLPVGKLFKPGQVTDLQITSVNLQENTIILTWTAQGAELTYGTVSSYEIRYATDFKSIDENFTRQALVSQSMLTTGNLTGPSAPGQTEIFTVRMPSGGDVTYIFSLISIDLDGRDAQSEPSNTASAGMKAFRGVDPPDHKKNAIIVGSVFAGLLLVAIIALISILRFKSAKSNQSPDGHANIEMTDAGNYPEHGIGKEGSFDMA